MTSTILLCESLSFSFMSLKIFFMSIPEKLLEFYIHWKSRFLFQQ